MIQITKHPEGSIVAVRAQPGARRNGIVGEQAGALKVAATAPPDKGRANAALIEILAESLGVKRSEVELVSGATSRAKKFLVRGMAPETLHGKLNSILANRAPRSI